MKKSLLLLTMLFTISIVSAQTEFTEGDITYKIIDDAGALEVEVTSAGTLETKVVPATVTNTLTTTTYDVIGIGAGAFNPSPVITLELPASVKYLGFQAFRNSTLQSISFTTVNALETIDNGAFRVASFVTSIDNILASTAPVLKIIGNAFQQTTMPSVVFPSNTIDLSESVNMFNASPLITSIDLSAVTFTAIPANMFRGTGITSMDFSGTSITALGNNTFLDCSALETINLGDVSIVGDNCFRNCDALTGILTNQETPPTSGATIWNAVDDPASINVYVPTAAAKIAFDADAQWGLTNVIVGTSLNTDSLEKESLGIYVDQYNMLSIKSSSTINASAYVYDLTGKQLLNKTINNSLTVDLSNLTSGIYIVRINDGKTDTVKKIVLSN